ncbi:MAG TPA: hypothetical protein VF742_00960 [Terracidiphilus sp.]
MNTTKATYWMALAVFALALNSEYRHGNFPALHRVASQAGTTMCRVATRAEHTLAMARLLTGRPALPADDLLALNTSEMAENQAEMLREQAQVEAEVLRDQTRDQAERLRDQVRAQVEMLRAQAQMQRDQIEQIRFRTQSRVRISNAMNRRVVVVGTPGCSKSDLRVAVNAGPEPADEDTY